MSCSLLQVHGFISEVAARCAVQYHADRCDDQQPQYQGVPPSHDLSTGMMLADSISKFGRFRIGFKFHLLHTYTHTKTSQMNQAWTFTLKMDRCPQTYDNASHTPSPANNVPNPTTRPKYATTCTPTRGKNTGVCSSERHQLTPHTATKVHQNASLHDGGTSAIFSKPGKSAGGKPRYPADSSKTKPRESNIDAIRSKHDTNTGTRFYSGVRQ